MADGFMTQLPRIHTQPYTKQTNPRTFGQRYMQRTGPNILGFFIEGYTHAPNAYMAVAHGWENVRVCSLFAFAKQFLHLFDEVLFATFGISATAFGHLAVTVDYEYVGNHVHTHGTTEVAVRVEQYLVFPSL